MWVFYTLNIGTFSNIISVFIMFFLSVSTIFLLISNRNLRREINDLKMGNMILNREKDREVTDIMSISELSKEDDRELNLDIDVDNKKDIKKEIKKSSGDVVDNMRSNLKNKTKVNVNSKRPYSKNILYSTVKNTSPVALDVSVDDFNVSEYVKNNKRENDNKDYLQAVKEALANESVPEPIVLTDYEKDQEDNAIISCRELMNIGKKNNSNTPDETLEFIEELKNFRNNLK